jgi:hypothetical protein
MAVVVTSTTALSVAANGKSSDQVSGQYQYSGRGKYTLVAKGSATGLNVTCAVGGIALVNDQPIPYTGTAGTISINDNVITSQMMNGGRVELTFRNTTGGALTADSLLLYDPM